MEEQIKQLQEQLAKQEKMASLGLLSAGIAHEIQNPLNFVINFSKMSAKLADDLADIVGDISDADGAPDPDDLADLEDIAADLKENMLKIQEHGERAISIIRGILLQSRGKAGEFLPADICQLVHEYVWLGYHAMRANDKNFNVAIKEDMQEGMPKMMVIPQDLSRAVLNIVNNAFYTLKERSADLAGSAYVPTLKVKVSYDPSAALSPSTGEMSEVQRGSVAISIADNGMGMSDEVKTRLFENFFSTKPVGQGTGLGMGITRKIIVENHGGELQLESEEGVGTTFTFIIPAKPVK